MADLPPDMAMLLRLIDSKFETQSAKLDGLHSTLSAMGDRFASTDRRLDDHETRIKNVEQWRAGVQTVSATGARWVELRLGAIVAVISTVAVFLAAEATKFL
jgi:hypothetical protein